MGNNTVKAVNRFYIIVFIIILFPSTLWAINIKSPFNNKMLNLEEHMDEYSFLMVGHIYGIPDEKSVFPASSFIVNTDSLNDIGARFFILMGDLYREADELHLNNFLSVARRLEMPLFNTVGNHEMENRSLYRNTFGKTYFYFQFNQELFIILDSELSVGEIKGDQLNYFKNAAQKALNDNTIRNIFVFSHKLIWCYRYPDYRVVFAHMNQQYAYPQSENFREKVEPILLELSKHKSVYWFSGDLGPARTLPMFYDKRQDSSITYIAAGLGDTDRDAIIQVKLNRGEVTINSVSLTGKAVKPVEQYDIAYWKKYFNYEDETLATRFKKIAVKIKNALVSKKFWAGAFSAIVFMVLIRLLLYRSERPVYNSSN